MSDVIKSFDMTMSDHEEILFQALQRVRSTGVSALQALEDVGSAFDDEARSRAFSLFREASLRPELGQGEAFQASILERALRRKITFDNSIVQSKRNIERRNENMENEKSNLVASKTRKYVVSEKLATVATLGLKPVDRDKNPTCEYQFSRKTNVEGTFDLPADTSVIFMGNREVYAGQASSKRMIFKVPAGTKILSGGVESSLLSDIEVAGVQNHIDPNASYNDNARKAAAKKLAREALKAQASTAKTKAA